MPPVVACDRAWTHATNCCKRKAIARKHHEDYLVGVPIVVENYWCCIDWLPSGGQDTSVC
eukprot:15016165-Heterocapsa_arctica.AAC.1